MRNIGAGLYSLKRASKRLIRQHAYRIAVYRKVRDW